MVRSILYVVMTMIVLTGNGTVYLPEIVSNETEIQADILAAGDDAEKAAESETEKETEEDTATAVISTNISEKEAMAIAEEWAKKDAYIYDDWREAWGYEYTFVSNGARLFATEKELLDGWFGKGYIYTDADNNPLYYGQPIWFVSLHDRYDILISLFIYVDADTGAVVGCNAVSD